MPSTQPDNQKPSASKQPLLTPSNQNVLLVITTGALLLMYGYWWYQGGFRGELIEIDRAEPLQASYQVDVNRADWPELIQLPGLGETLAKRVLADRHQKGPYRNLDELVRVNGIGPRTLEKIRPYLIPIPSDTDWAALEKEQQHAIQ